MKKIVIAAAVFCAALVSQAAQVKWVSGSNFLGVGAAAVGDNGVYAADGAKLKGNSALTYVLSIYAAGTDELVYTASGDMKFGATNQKTNLSWTDDAIELGTAYDYVITLTGTQSDLTARGVDGKFDYSAATISATINGSVTTATSGFTTIADNASTWTVSGVAAVPEPTSGLLMLVGLAGLALRRRRA